MSAIIEQLQFRLLIQHLIPTIEPIRTGKNYDTAYESYSIEGNNYLKVCINDKDKPERWLSLNLKWKKVQWFLNKYIKDPKPEPQAMFSFQFFFLN